MAENKAVELYKKKNLKYNEQEVQATESLENSKKKKEINLKITDFLSIDKEVSPESPLI